MPTYATVLWQPDDEITSEKLNQMAQNEDYLNQYAVKSSGLFNITTDPTYGNAIGGGTGRWQSGLLNTTRTNTARACVLASFDYTYGAPVAQVDFNVMFPNIFTQPPFSVVTASQTLDPLVCWIPDNSFTDHCKVSVQRNDGQSQTAWDFTVMLIAEGV